MNDTYDKYKNMSPEDRSRWHYLNDCTCQVVEGWWIPANHYGQCPLENSKAEMWDLFLSIEEGFIFPKGEL